MGWKEAIIRLKDRLPNGFELKDIYQLEGELQKQFPSNKNIKAKIRQQLQVLIKEETLQKKEGKYHWTGIHTAGGVKHIPIEVESDQLILMYPSVRDVFHHPKSMDEFKSIFSNMCKCNENKDALGVFTNAMQLIPNRFVDKEYYLLFVWGDVEPKLIGPFQTPDERDKAALEKHKVEGEENGYYKLDMNGIVPEVDVYSGDFFEEE